MTPSSSIPRVLRIAILILAIAAMSGVAAAAASPAHIHATSPAGGCDICFTAHIVKYQATFVIEVPAAPEAVRQAFASGVAIAGYQLFSNDTSSTRGPPAAL